MDTSVYLGKLHLMNPVVVGAGPWCRDAATIQRCIDQKPGAVTTETITLEANSYISPRMYVSGQQTLNTKMFSDLHLEQWEEELGGIQKGDCKLICSIWGNSPSELTYLTRKVIHMGADAVEISMAPPIRARGTGMVPKIIKDCLRAAVTAADGVPVIAKISYEACHSPEIMRSVREAGVQIVTAINGLKGLIGIDIERQRSLMPTFGGFNGVSIHPLALAATASLKQNTPFHICSCGGTMSYENVLEFIMLGASCVELASVIQIEGYSVISRIVGECEDWLERHHYSNYFEIQGSALTSLHMFEDLKSCQLGSTLISECKRTDCDICVRGCLYDGIYRDQDGRIRIDRSRCSGCGHCVARCPDHKLSLNWEPSVVAE